MADSTVSPCKGVAPAAVKEGEDPSADSSKQGSGVSLRETSASAIDTSADSSTASSVSTPAAGTAPAAAADSEPAAAASGSAPAAGGSAPAASATDSSDEADEKPGSLIQSLLAYVESKLPGTHTDTDEQQCVLNSLDQAGVVDYIKSGRCKNVITLAGAGISTSAGIPDFRSPDSGLYNNLEAYDLPQPEAVFELSYFRRNPQPFFKLAKELYPGEFRPTPCHYFVRLLETKGLLRRHYTQNIDTLEHVAGISADKVVEAHGTFRTAHCLDCRKPYTQSWVKMEVFADRVPTCLDCNGVVKPDIVFFGESLPTRFFESVSSDFSRCDMLLIMGTSLTVQPFAGLIEYVGPECPRVLINRETVGETDSFMEKLNRLMNRMSGLRLSRSDNYRDVALLGDCDDTCINLAKLLGWQEELQKLIDGGPVKPPE